MSNLSTLPKGDSAWLLRKSIQRIMQQVSVLETNIGSSTTGNSANTQVIFNDAGTLRGDAGLTYNKTTDTLSTGSATITGDLTVDTSTLKVDSANNRVGIGTASPTVPLDVVGEIKGTSSGVSHSFSADANYGWMRSSGTNLGLLIGTTDSKSVNLITGNTIRATLDSSGNLGLGVTPSAWGLAGGAAAQLPGGAISSYATSNFTIAQNAFFNGTDWKYKNTAAASYYQQTAGAHAWHNAVSGTAGNTITFTQAMTLDASGNLLLGKTARNLTTGGVELLPTGQTTVTVASSDGGFTTSEVYSTTAAAYRFYVGMNGTVSATNTTISAISDARLKENVQDIDVGLGAILALKPRKFDWKEGKGKNIKGDRGFIAQEFETVFPNLIDEWKDPAPAGESPYKSVRQDLIPVLVKAIQELTARVQTLETR